MFEERAQRFAARIRQNRHVNEKDVDNHDRVLGGEGGKRGLIEGERRGMELRVCVPNLAFLAALRLSDWRIYCRTSSANSSSSSSTCLMLCPVFLCGTWSDS